MTCLYYSREGWSRSAEPCASPRRGPVRLGRRRYSANSALATGQLGQSPTNPAGASDSLAGMKLDTGRKRLHTADKRQMLVGATSLGGEILDLLHLSGGRTEGVRQLADQLGRARSTVSDEEHRLVAAGRKTLTRGPRSSAVALAA